MIYGYVRVSTKEQNEDRQLNAMRERNIDKKNIFIDRQSGKDFNRKSYMNLIKKIKKGDVVVVKSIDRLGRNYNEVLEQWRIITKVKGADIIVIDMPVLDTTKNKDLIGTLISDIVLQLLSYVADNERTIIKQRQAEGIAAAKKRGVKFGRPKKYNPKDYIDIYEKRKSNEITQKEAVKKMGVCNGTYYKIMNSIKNTNYN